MNVNQPRKQLFVRAERVNYLAGNRDNKELSRRRLVVFLTGVVGVSEPVEMSRGTWEGLHIPQEKWYRRHKWSNTRLARKVKVGGVSRSSEEASNDRGAKGWQIVIA